MDRVHQASHLVRHPSPSGKDGWQLVPERLSIRDLEAERTSWHCASCVDVGNAEVSSDSLLHRNTTMCMHMCVSTCVYVYHVHMHVYVCAHVCRRVRACRYTVCDHTVY